ncbi:MAG TPA: response regulator [Thermoanaerobaculia bacterium]
MTSERQVVLCDDTATAASPLVQKLRARGLDVEIIAEGYDAIELLQTSNPAAIVIEVMLRGDLSGFGVLNHIELEKPQLIPRTFIVTSMAEQAALRFAPHFGSRIYGKPVDPDVLVAAIAASVDGPAPQPQLESDLILVVDDDRETRDLLVSYVEGHGYRTRQAADGRAALEAIEISSPSLILLDLMMPGIDGASVLEYFSDCCPELLPRTVILTGMPRQYIDMLPNHPVRGVLGKPVDPAQLATLIERRAE